MSKKAIKSSGGVPQKRPQIRLNSENAPSFYANSIEVASSNWDFRVKGSEIVDATPDKLVVKDLFTIYLSPSHAKVVAILLTKKVMEYEKKFGELPIPESFKTSPSEP